MSKTISLILVVISALSMISCNEKEPKADSYKGFTSFTFQKAQNPELSENVICTINENGSITGEIKDLLSSYVLIPTFTTEAQAVYVDTELQTSGISPQNFASPVYYRIQQDDGTIRVVSVKITVPERPLLPTIRINTENGAQITDKKNYVKGSVVISDPDRLYWDIEELTLNMTEDGIRGRGNTTWDMPKKPYKLKFDEKVSIFNLPKDKEWVLLANYADKSLMRNIVAMKLSKILGMKWTPAMLPVEVYLNNEYLGCYTFSEHKKVAEGRVDLDIVSESDNEGEALTGDYYFEIESRMDETTCFRTAIRNIPMMFLEPEIPTDAQYNYIYDYFKEAELALESADFRNPDKGWQKYIDAESFAKAFIINELAKNIDGNMRKSTFITKEKGKKLEMYHIWDYDITFGNCNYMNQYGGTNGPEGWFIKTVSLDGGKNWYIRLAEDPSFCALVKKIWKENHTEISKLTRFMDQQALLMLDAQKRNFEKWNILNKLVWPNVDIFGSYEKEVEYLKDFYTRRVEWLDQAFNVADGEIF